MAPKNLKYYKHGPCNSIKPNGLLYVNNPTPNLFPNIQSKNLIQPPSPIPTRPKSLPVNNNTVKRSSSGQTGQTYYPLSSPLHFTPGYTTTIIPATLNPPSKAPHTLPQPTNTFPKPYLTTITPWQSKVITMSFRAKISLKVRIKSDAIERWGFVHKVQEIASVALISEKPAQECIFLPTTISV